MHQGDTPDFDNDVKFNIDFSRPNTEVWDIRQEGN